MKKSLLAAKCNEKYLYLLFKTFTTFHASIMNHTLSEKPAINAASRATLLVLYSCITVPQTMCPTSSIFTFVRSTNATAHGFFRIQNIFGMKNIFTNWQM